MNTAVTPNHSVEMPRLKLRRSLPVLGRFAADPLGTLSMIAARGEPALRLRGLDLSIVILHDPELVGQALMTHADAFAKDRFTRDLETLLGQGLLTSEGDLWKRQRRMIAPSLAPRQIATYADCMVRRTRHFVERLPAQGQVDVHQALMRLTLDIVVETLFGSELDTRDGHVGELIEEIMEDYVLLVRSWRRLIPRWIPQPVVGRIRRASRQIDTVIEAIVAQKRAGALQGDDLLTRLLLARDEAAPGADQGMDDRQLRDELVTLFTAGHETTALTLGYSLHALADRPALQEAIRGEAESLAPGRALAVGDVARMPLTTAVIRESMRMYPPAWIIGREALRDCNIGPYRVRRKEQVLIAPYTLHRDSRWFEAPDEFRPERWQDGLYERLPKYAYLPFGGGPRICIGNHFAMMEAVLVLATILRGALFTPASAAATLRFFPSVTLRPAGGLPLSVTRA